MADESDAELIGASLDDPARCGTLFDRHATVVFRYLVRRVGVDDAESPHVADAVAALPEGERDALLLYVWEELSYDEIACALDVPVGTVRSRLNRARETLRELRASIGRQP
jgi:RNA polymerase sigma factor (sigma-70 family)